MFRKYQIWKLQRPMFSGSLLEFPEIMAYTEGKERLAMIPMGYEMIEQLFGEEYKIYVKGSVVNGVLKVKRQVPDQDW